MRTHSAPITGARLAGTITCLSLASVLVAQPYWVRNLGSLGNDLISDVKVDEAGDIFITGEFSGSTEFGDSTHTAIGGIDCFVAKLSASGQEIWWKQGGGFGIDRGIRLAFGPNNTIAVVGEFMGVADFQGISITSQGFTPDMFCAVLDRATGTQQWIRHGGGSAGSDRAYGVTVSPSGQVTMVGEFRGMATWNGFSLSSVPEPDTGDPGIDVVVVSYSATGTALWVQQGAAEYTDRAIDVVNDPLGNIYVAGQFSDTITFDATHTNAMYNATFLLKLDASGQEQWFRRCGGATFDHVRDLIYTPSGELLLTGDLQGSMIFLDNVPDFISGESAFSYYLLRVDTAGELIAHSVFGSSNGVSARGIDLRNDTITVLGQFNCQFTGLSSHYGGTGLFMAAGAEDVFVTKHRFNDLGFIEARHFGGPGSKLAGQVATLPNGDVLFCGSYTRSLSFATTDDNPIAIDPFEFFEGTAQADPPGSCPDLANTEFLSQDCRGLKDGLLARAYVEDSVVYDWWSQMVGVCDHPPAWIMCAGAELTDPVCPDTLVFCGPGAVTAYVPFLPSFGLSNSVGPLVDVHWSNGDSTFTANITTTGMWSVQVSARNGCWSWSDSIYVIINPMPPKPLISDNLSQNTNSQTPSPIYLCEPDSALVWCNNVDPSTTSYWTMSQNNVLSPDTNFNASFTADTTGFYAFTMITDEGCSRTTTINVIDQAVPDLGELTVDLSINFPQDTANTDSVWLCQGSPLILQVLVQWYVSGGSVPFPQYLTLLYSLNNSPWGPQLQPNGWSSSNGGYFPGWNYFNLRILVLNGPCGDDSLLFEFNEGIWIGIWPETVVNISISGANTMCTGDSTLLTMTCENCEGFEWSGESISGAITPSVWVTSDGNYAVHGYATDIHGCSYDDDATHHVSFPMGPLLLSDPVDGIICPFDSALIYTTTPGIAQVWYGPFGPVPNGSQQLWSEIPGEYYLTMTDLQGCELVSDPLLLTGYGTPFLNIYPDNVLCLNEEEVLVQVVTTVPSSIVWAAPLSGNSLEQIITEPGSYSVSSSACGITTELSVTVFASDVDAQVLEVGPYYICEGDSVVLHSVPGEAVYIWQPGNVFADDLVVTSSGEYTLEVVDGNGCTDTSATIIVEVFSTTQPLMAIGDTICLGEAAIISALGSGAMNWYSDASAQNLLFSGSPITVSGLVSNTTYFVIQTDSVCTSGVDAALVIVEPVPSVAVIDAPSFVCGDTEALISLIAAPGVSATWTTPSGTYTGTQIDITAFGAGDSGVYTAYPFVGNCVGEPASVVVTFAAPMPFDLGPDTTYCFGGTFTLQIPTWYTDPNWFNGAQGYALQVSSEGYYEAYAFDTNGCKVQDEVFVSGTECETIVPNIITPNGDGVNDGWTLDLNAGGFVGAEFVVFGRWGNEVFHADPTVTAFRGETDQREPLSEGVYYYALRLFKLDNTTRVLTGYMQVNR